MIPIPATLTTFAAKISVSGAIMAALGTGLVVQTVRLDGFKLWPVSIEGANPRAARLSADLGRMKAAQAIAHERAVQAREAAQEQLADIAEKHNAERTEMQAIADRALRAHVGQLRPQAYRGAPSGPVAPTDSGSASVPVDVPPDTLVATSFADLQICTDLTSYALGAHFYAVDVDAWNQEIEALEGP